MCPEPRKSTFDKPLKATDDGTRCWIETYQFENNEPKLLSFFIFPSAKMKYNTLPLLLSLQFGVSQAVSMIDYSPGCGVDAGFGSWYYE